MRRPLCRRVGLHGAHRAAGDAPRRRRHHVPDHEPLPRPGDRHRAGVRRRRRQVRRRCRLVHLPGGARRGSGGRAGVAGHARGGGARDGVRVRAAPQAPQLPAGGDAGGGQGAGDALAPHRHRLRPGDDAPPRRPPRPLGVRARRPGDEPGVRRRAARQERRDMPLARRVGSRRPHRHRSARRARLARRSPADAAPRRGARAPQRRRPQRAGTRRADAARLGRPR